MIPTIKALNDLFIRDLDRLEHEINLYEDEKDLWLVSSGISNCAGNLCLHICGNLQHFIGATLGGSGYVRKRDNEFGLKNIARKELLELIATSKNIVSSTLSNLDESKLADDYPIEVFGKPMTVAFFLVHLNGHLNYHLGQINYHRRLLTQA